ncbi:MAG TPA: hypothetical protein PKK61_02575 [Defluviitaleaceae bacterium]|nr:hypothetical protein [Candidatus Epulonipiscium sp.]HOA79934.1 hypothetical protein [Defluviitaleaceae bacterium]
MNNNHLEELKEKYKEGFRCIRTDKENDVLTVHLKNFYNEKIDTIKCNNQEEIEKMITYINSTTEEFK